jgi:hypothetical protein
VPNQNLHFGGTMYKVFLRIYAKLFFSVQCKLHLYALES